MKLWCWECVLLCWCEVCIMLRMVMSERWTISCVSLSDCSSTR